MSSQIKIGDTVVILYEYHLAHGCKVIRVNKKSITVSVPAGAIHGFTAFEKAIKPERVAKYGDNLCVVWQQWKTQSTISYRFEYEMYKQYHRPAETWGNGFYSNKNIPSYIEEPQYGVFGKAT